MWQWLEEGRPQLGRQPSWFAVTNEGQRKAGSLLRDASAIHARLVHVKHRVSHKAAVCPCSSVCDVPCHKFKKITIYIFLHLTTTALLYVCVWWGGGEMLFELYWHECLW